MLNIEKYPISVNFLRYPVGIAVIGSEDLLCNHPEIVGEIDSGEIL